MVAKQRGQSDLAKGKVHRTRKGQGHAGLRPSKGVTHLKKLGLLPDTVESDTEDEDDEDILLEDIMADPGNNKLNKLHKQESKVEGMGENCACGIPASNVKSGKYAKTTNRIIRQEIWAT